MATILPFWNANSSGEYTPLPEYTEDIHRNRSPKNLKHSTMSQQDVQIEMEPISGNATRPRSESLQQLEQRDQIAEVKNKLYVNKVNRGFRRLWAYSPFCPTCGTNALGFPHGKSQSADVGINARTLMDVDIWALEGKPYDGVATEPAYKPHEFAGPLPTLRIPPPWLGATTVAIGPGGPFAEHTEYVQECNCSICMQNGTIFFYPLRPQVSISDPSNSPKAYMMGRKFQQHKFRSTCSVSVYIGKEGLPEEAAKWPDARQSIWPQILPVNLRIMDGVNWDQIVVKRAIRLRK
ncbi:hypothetical protein GMDG_06656 [Pseudogymnoascus destructans 20631-21]|uniref:CENP-V/GFA domain-containing protein n=1 Tax=Pseudogymnoascus destructans (strain ATCC MYA-4855 / 20631-21) TaxID=658429 RepID=L8FUT1_PSED2|nr:hypothetical protein GMDG_06656 [Pseudogymnoascus destructans 20631-21]